MYLHLLTMPSGPGHLSRWLECQLVGPCLGELVAELSGLADEADGAPPALAEVLGPYRGDVLERGLAVLPANMTRHLLGRPALLLDLQELVLCEGGAYWDQVNREPIVTPAPEQLVKLVWYRRPWVVSLATAAAVLIAVKWFVPAGSTPPVSQQDMRTVTTAPADLCRTGTACLLGEEWLSRRSAPDLRRSLQELSQRSAELSRAAFPSLAPEDREELRQTLSGLVVELDRQRASLDNGQDGWQVRQAVDLRVSELIAHLQTPDNLPPDERIPEDLPSDEPPRG
jgi:hypothetical protein